MSLVVAFESSKEIGIKAASIVLGSNARFIIVN